MSEEPAGDNPEGYEVEPLPYIASSQQQVNPAAMEAGTSGEAASAVQLPDVQTLPLRRKRKPTFWIAGSIIGILLLIAAIFVVIYINRSTPDKTLGTFCGALQGGDYRTAYDQFSQKLQSVITEPAFAAIFAHDKVTACTYSAINETGNSAKAGLELVHASKGTNRDGITLAKDGKNSWKIDDFYRQT